MVRKKKIEVLQTKQQLIINALDVFSFASSFAKISTSTRLYQSLRLQNCQLSPLTSLQAQAVSFAVCKEKVIENQSVTKFPFATLFAQNHN